MVIRIPFTTRLNTAASERGAVTSEYALFLSLVAVALVASIQGLTGGIINTFQAIIDVLP